MQTPFDSENYTRINLAREVWLRRVLSDVPFRNELHTVLDIGCGAGFFSGILHELGFEVTGVDLQQENLDECKRRYPHCRFELLDLDKPGFELGQYDLVLMFGILYHLISPLQTVMNISSSINTMAIVSTRVASGSAMAFYLHRENVGRSHNRASVVSVPTLSALVGTFQAAGIEYIYYPRYQPNHREWKIPKNGRRHSFIVSRNPISVPEWRRLKAVKLPQKWEPIVLFDRLLQPLGKAYRLLKH